MSRSPTGEDISRPGTKKRRSRSGIAIRSRSSSLSRSKPRSLRRYKSRSRSLTRVYKSRSRSHTRYKSRSRSSTRRRYKSRSNSRTSYKSRSRTSSPGSPKRDRASDAKIQLFLGQERLLMEKMDAEKWKYMGAPETHPDYAREWEKFYTSKCNQYGPLHSSYLQDEWVNAWKTYFYNRHVLLLF